MLQHSQLEAWLQRALAAAQLLETLHARQCTHGGLNPHTLHVRADNSLRLRPPPRSCDLSLEQLRYAAPEQAGRLAPPDARSDLYSLGLILYEWLLHKPAFTSQDPVQLAYQQIAMLPVPPHQLNPQLPQPLSALVMRLLAKPPEARYASAQGLADDLQHCLQQWKKQGRLEPFTLGSTDQQALFMVPDRLYGRGDAMAKLVHLWRHVAGVQLCLVRGDAGMGKTALVRALRDTVLASGGILLEGRFTAAQRSTPYSALIDALRKRLRQVLAGTQSELLHWRAQLQSHLGERVLWVMELLPELEWICGHPTTPPVAVAAQAPQLHNALLDVLTLFTGAKHPMLLFLDDVHFADKASLALIQALLLNRRASHVLLVCTCCDDLPAGSAHARAFPAAAASIRLAPLNSEELAALIDDCCFHLRNLPALVERTLQQTRGIPGPVLQFLGQQVQQGHLRYESSSRRWCWTEGQQPIDHSAALAALWCQD